MYLFHRINGALDGTPTMIVLDEAWALIDNPIFGPKIKDWLNLHFNDISFQFTMKFPVIKFFYFNKILYVKMVGMAVK